MHKDKQVAQHAHHQPKPSRAPIKHSTAAQALPRINMVFPTPCSMPHRNPPHILIPRTQTTLDKYWTRKQTIPHTHAATTTKTHTRTPPSLNKETDPTPYRHPAIHAVTFNTRGMHNTILNLHRILNTTTKPIIIYHTEVNIAKSSQYGGKS